MASKPNTATKAKATTRRKKIEIKKVEQKSRRHVTFSKRKLGLFNKVTELSILSEAETALIVISENGKLYACGHPSPDAVIGRYLARGSPQQHVHTRERAQHCDSVETLRQQYEATLNELEEEKKHLHNIIQARKAGSSCPFWYNQPIEDMGLEDLEQFKASMELLMQNLIAASEEMKLNSLPPIPLSLPSTQDFSSFSQLNGCVSKDQAWNWKGSSSSSNFMVPKSGFGHY